MVSTQEKERKKLGASAQLTLNINCSRSICVDLSEQGRRLGAQRLFAGATAFWSQRTNVRKDRDELAEIHHAISICVQRMEHRCEEAGTGWEEKRKANQYSPKTHGACKRIDCSYRLSVGLGGACLRRKALHLLEYCKRDDHVRPVAQE
jgi:hypothetical protein